MEHSVSLSAPSGAGECSRPPDLLIIKSSTVSHLRAQFERRQAEAKLAATSNNGKLVESDPSELSLTREDETSGVETATGESPSQQRQETEKSQSAKQLSVRRKSLSDASCGPVSRSCDRSTIAGSLVKKMEGRSKSLNDATVVPIKAAFGRSATVGALVKKLEGHSKSSSDDNLTSAKPTCQINAVGSLVEMLARQSRGQPRANGAQKSASSTGRSPECSPTLVSVGQDEEMQVSPIAALKAKFERQSSCTSSHAELRTGGDPVKSGTPALGEAMYKLRTKPPKDVGFASVSALKEQFEHGQAVSAPPAPPVSPVGELTENVRKKKEMLSTIDIAARYGRNYQPLKGGACSQGESAEGDILKDPEGDKRESVVRAELLVGESDVGNPSAADGTSTLQGVSVSHHASHKIEVLAMQVGAVALNFAKTPPPRLLSKNSFDDADGGVERRRPPQPVGDVIVPVDDRTSQRGNRGEQQADSETTLEESKREDCEQVSREGTQSPVQCFI